MTATAEPTDPDKSTGPSASTGPGDATVNRQRVNPPGQFAATRDPLPGPPNGARRPGDPAGQAHAERTAARPDLAPADDGDVKGSPMLGQLRTMVRTFDRWAEQPFAQLRGNKAADRLFYGASEAANFSALWHVMAWAPMLVRPSPHRLIRAVGTSGSLAVESVLVNGPVKSAFRRTRPVLEHGHLHTYRLRKPRSTSFPSGHASAAMVAALVMGRDRNRLSRGLLLTVASVVSASRVHVRIHHPSDVVGGAMIGWMLGRFLRLVLP